MKPTDQELKAFSSLSTTETGKTLVAYSKRLIDFVHDSRNWNEGDTKESAAHAARVLQRYLVDKLTLINHSKVTEKNPFT